MTLETLSNDELLATVKALVREGDRILVNLIAHIGEVDARGLHIAHECSSMFEFCVKRLRLHPGEAFLRLTAARLARRFPRLLRALASRSMTLTTIVMLRDFYTDENVDALIDEARGKSKREVKKIIARLRPRPDVPSTIRALPASGSAAMRPDDSAQAEQPVAGAQPYVRLTVEPLSPGRYEFRFTGDETLRAEFESARDMMSHRNPSGDFAPIFRSAFKLLNAELRKERFGQTNRPQKRRRHSAPGHVSQATRREVAARDGERCSFVGTSGARCTETRFLEWDHIVPRARGGSDEASNIRILCRKHNRRAAEEIFGEAYVAAAIEARRNEARDARSEAASERLSAMTVEPAGPSPDAATLPRDFVQTKSAVPGGSPRPTAARKAAGRKQVKRVGVRGAKSDRRASPKEATGRTRSEERPTGSSARLRRPRRADLPVPAGVDDS